MSSAEVTLRNLRRNLAKLKEDSRLPEESTQSWNPPHSLPNAYLHKVLKKDLKLTKFKGVFPCNLLRKPRNGESIILNTDPNYMSGKHFVAISRKNGRFIYFDPLAESLSSQFPELYQELKKQKMFPLAPVLTSPIQAMESNFCGLFCLDYVLGLYLPFSNAKCVKYKLHPSQLLKNDQICLNNIVRKLKKK